MILNVRVIPKSSRNEIIKSTENNWKVKLTVAPIDNKANESLIKILAKELGLSKSHLKIISGLRSKNKVIEFN